MVIEDRLVQLENVLSSIFVTLNGIVIEDRLVQPSNAPYSIFVTLNGIIIEDKLVQPSKAVLPILSKSEVILTVVKLSQLKNALLPILLTLPPIVYSFTCVPKIYLRHDGSGSPLDSSLMKSFEIKELEFIVTFARL